jgi:transcriptional regulator with PAS, ATPase and Fis domain
VQASWFRQDVYYRLNEFVITLPPLRERDDILDLANGFLVEANMEFGRACREISERAAEVLLRYPWPGERARTPERHSPGHAPRFGCN